MVQWLRLNPCGAYTGGVGNLPQATPIGRAALSTAGGIGIPVTAWPGYVRKPLEDWGKRWFALQFEQGQRKLAISEIENKRGLRVWCPLEERVIIRRGSRVATVTPLFFRYMFVEFDVYHEPEWRALKRTRGVAGFFNQHSELPVPCERAAMEDLLRREAAGEWRHEVDLGNYTGPQYQEEDVVRILDGPFTSFNGIVRLHEADRISVFASIFGRKTPIDLYAKDVVLVQRARKRKAA